MLHEPVFQEPPVGELPPGSRSAWGGLFRDYTSCVACGGEGLFELCGFAQMHLERKFRERFFQDLYPEGTPEYMLKDRAYPTQTYESRLLACEACGTIARDPHLSPRGSVKEYSEDDYHPTWLESSYREFHATFGELMPELVRRVGRRARVLEVGSFVGGFLAAARDHGWRAQGIDVGECVVSFSRSKGLDVQDGTLRSARLPSRAFDAVFVWFCFDQLPEPERDLEEIHRVLKNDGYLRIRVPNGDFVKCMQRLLRIPSESVREAVLRVLSLTGLASFPFQVGYTPGSLGDMLRDAGFASVSVGNRVNLRGANPARDSFWNLADHARTLERVHATSQVLHHASLGALSLGPWIEVSCSKAEPASDQVPVAIAWSTLHLPLPWLAM